MIPAESHELFRRMIDRDRRYVLVTHVNPDGDAIGSQLGLARFLISRSTEVQIVNQDAVPHTLRFLDYGDVPIRTYDPAEHDRLIASVDRVVLLDNSAPDRLGRIEPVITAAADRTLCIDHHPTCGTPWADNILDFGASATSAMVFELARATGWNPDPRAAEALYVGLATDTGFFRFSSATRDAHLVAAELIGAGADPARCFQEIHERNSPAYVRLLGSALGGLRVETDGAVVSIVVTREMMDRSGLADADTSEMTTPLLAIDGVSIAAMFRELPDGRIKVSLRSKGEIDVQRLAAEFGGGGHRNASGIVMAGELEEVYGRVSSAASSLVERTPRGGGS